MKAVDNLLQLEAQRPQEKILLFSVQNHNKKGAFPFYPPADLCISLVVYNGGTMFLPNLREALSLEEQARAVIFWEKFSADRTYLFLALTFRQESSKLQKVKLSQ